MDRERGDGHVARADTLILCEIAGLFGENGVVFLRKVRWISFHRSGDEDNAEKTRVLFDIKFNLAKGKRVGKTYIPKLKTWDLVKLILGYVGYLF